MSNRRAHPPAMFVWNLQTTRKVHTSKGSEVLSVNLMHGGTALKSNNNLNKS